ncbi:MAG TPA: DUF1002 domain-containing protein [Syntrophomonadaceae bacterium]|nr:DUF1002 domain-containing protein [Syntrophomonadaceae bacterium]
MQKRFLAINLVIILFLVGLIFYQVENTSPVLSEKTSKVVITLGEDLTEKQKQEVMKTFDKWKNNKNVRIITVSNAEERKYLEGKIDDKLIGTKAISSSYCELLNGTAGLDIETEKITAITPFMYANALTTAGVEDARLLVIAPFEVSGTAALTGIIKAFETATGKELDENAKKTAYQELSETYKLSDKYGQSSAENMIHDIKRQIIDRDVTSPEQIKPIIIEISNHYNIELTSAEIDRIMLLMQKYQNIKLDTGKIDEQLNNISRSLAEIKGVANKSLSVIEKIIDFFKNMIAELRNMFG